MQLLNPPKVAADLQLQMPSETLPQKEKRSGFNYINVEDALRELWQPSYNNLQDETRGSLTKAMSW